MANAGTRNFGPNLDPLTAPERRPGQPAPEGGESGLIATVKEKAQDIAETAGNLAGQAKEKVQGLTAAAAESVVGAKDTVQEWAAAGARWTGETAAEVGDQLTTLIRRYPMPALLASFALGFLIARALKR
ncbi:MAG TPA: hypothetical protein VNK04_27040 [Gemmataceae bacterium]|jgi:hypothetical protein|nr:hypothetical protein [Gemmataceae bacterium]